MARQHNISNSVVHDCDGGIDAAVHAHNRAWQRYVNRCCCSDEGAGNGVIAVPARPQSPPHVELPIRRFLCIARVSFEDKCGASLSKRTSAACALPAATCCTLALQCRRCGTRYVDG